MLVTQTKDYGTVTAKNCFNRLDCLFQGGICKYNSPSICSLTITFIKTINQ